MEVFQFNTSINLENNTFLLTFNIMIIQTTSLIFKVVIHLLLAKLVVFY